MARAGRGEARGSPVSGHLLLPCRCLSRERGSVGAQWGAAAGSTLVQVGVTSDSLLCWAQHLLPGLHSVKSRTQVQVLNVSLLSILSYDGLIC